MKTKKSHDLRPTCSVCGGTNVEDTAWIAYREDGSCYVVNGEGPLDGDYASTWCHDCEEHHDLVYHDIVGGLESNAAIYRRSCERIQNDAARERGPELLDALRSVITLAHSHFLLKGKKASRSDYDAFTQAQQLITQITTGKEG